MRLSESRLKKLRSKRRRYAISDGGGLMLHVLPSGRRSWVYRLHQGRTSRALKLGEYPERSLNWARRQRRKIGLALAMAEDPGYELGRLKERRRNEQDTLKEFAEAWYFEVAVQTRKDPLPVHRMLRVDIFPALGRRLLRSITTDDVRGLIFAKRDQGHGQAAAALRHLLKRIFDYAVACGKAASNPVLALPRKFVAPRRSRTRALTERELKAFLQKCRSRELGRMGWALELMLLTLCRKSELRLARIEHVDVGKKIWEVPAELSKTGQPHLVYLSERALGLFLRLFAAAGRSPFVLPKRDSVTEPITASALNKAVARVEWGIARFVPHDLRRTASTILNEQGYNADVIERALHHGAAGVRGVYNRAQYAEERRRMLSEWADYLEGLANG